MGATSPPIFFDGENRDVVQTWNLYVRKHTKQGSLPNGMQVYTGWDGFKGVATFMETWVFLYGYNEIQKRLQNLDIYLM